MQNGKEWVSMIFNFGRPNIDGSYTDEVKFGMIGVIVHEIGHASFNDSKF